MSDVMSDIVAHIHVMSVTEVVAVASYIVSIQIACVGRSSDQQKNKLEDQKYGEDDGNAGEDLLRQIHSFKPVYKKIHCPSPF